MYEFDTQHHRRPTDRPIDFSLRSDGLLSFLLTETQWQGMVRKWGNGGCYHFACQFSEDEASPLHSMSWDVELSSPIKLQKHYCLLRAAQKSPARLPSCRPVCLFGKLPLARSLPAVIVLAPLVQARRRKRTSSSVSW